MRAFTGREPRTSAGSQAFSTLHNAVSMGTGATAALSGRAVPTYGYFVGGATVSFVRNSVAQVKVHDVLDFLDYARGNAAEWVGVWVDDNDGRVYFDVSEWVADLGEAMSLAGQRGEKAVYGLAGDGVVYLPTS